MQLAGQQKYRLGEMLGAGGMAEVYRAELCGAEGFSRPVAIKRVLREHSQNPVFAEMFKSEAYISSLLSHPNVVSVIDFDRDDDGCLFLVMELVPGKDLNQLIKSGGPLPLSVIIQVTCEILRGLGYAHDLVHDGKHLGIVHRDVSPHNVLLSWDGAVKVSDFGIAKAAAATDATRSGMLKGKIAYMSPEQAHQVPLDGRSDLFAVGIMLYQMLVGQSPFEGGSIGEVLAHILVQDPRPPRELRPDVPAELEAITMRLLEKDRDRRFASAREAIAALHGCAAASPGAVDQLVALLRERYPNEAPRLPTAASAAATALAGGLAAGGSGTPGAYSASAWGSVDAPVPAAGGRPGGTVPLPGSVVPGHALRSAASFQVTPTPTAAGEAAPVPRSRPTGSRSRRLAVIAAATLAAATFAGVLLLFGRDRGPGSRPELGHAVAPGELDAGVPSTAATELDAGTPRALATAVDTRDAGPASPVASAPPATLDAATAAGNPSPAPVAAHREAERDPSTTRRRPRADRAPASARTGATRRPADLTTAPRKPSPRDWEIEIGKEDPARVPLKKKKKGTP